LAAAEYHRADFEIDAGLLAIGFLKRVSAGVISHRHYNPLDTKINPSSRAGSSSEDIPTLLLVGGMGTRLRSVLSDKPKPLAPIGGVAFLELLVLQLRSQGLRQLVMCTGFYADQIKEQFADGRKWDVTVDYSEESRPLGTAGAIKLAERFVSQASDFLVMNGDSFLELDLRRLIRFHREHGGLASIAVRQVPDAARYGTVHLDEENRVVGFGEKMGIPEPGVINGGVYVFKRQVFQHIPDEPSSLEKDVLPGLLSEGVFALEQNGLFIDIGTPEDYARAQSLYDSLSHAALSGSHVASEKHLQR
jgi:D-glycero-alpha-D-manno-heptose 1-phosphate guanylyltransferase